MIRFYRIKIEFHREFIDSAHPYRRVELSWIILPFWNSNETVEHILLRPCLQRRDNKSNISYYNTSLECTSLVSFNENWQGGKFGCKIIRFIVKWGHSLCNTFCYFLYNRLVLLIKVLCTIKSYLIVSKLSYELSFIKNILTPLKMYFDCHFTI